MDTTVARVATTDTAIQGLAPQGIYERFIRPALPEPEIFEKPRNLLWGFVGIHVVYLLGLLPNILAGTVEGDLPLYRRWAIAAESFGQWPGIHFEWVYPIGAILPIAISNLAGPQFYQLLWFVLIASLNAASILVLSNRGRSRRGVLASWWWLGILHSPEPGGPAAPRGHHRPAGDHRPRSDRAQADRRIRPSVSRPPGSRCGPPRSSWPSSGPFRAAASRSRPAPCSQWGWPPSCGRSAACTTSSASRRCRPRAGFSSRLPSPRRGSGSPS